MPPLPKKHPLGRIVNHDERSRAFAFNTEGLSIEDSYHERHIPILDQGQIGSCTGNAGTGDLATDPFIQDWIEELNQAFAVELYSQAQVFDGNPPYPESDFGASGLSIAKALLKRGLISGYQHTFSLDAALKAASKYPFITGTRWHEKMSHPDRDGQVHLDGEIVGGHEYLCRQIVADEKKIWFDNSWGEYWGEDGRFWMTFEDFGTLLKDNGDVTILFPPHITPPTPLRMLRFAKPMMFGDDIKEVQALLRIKVDGWFGKDTLRAVVAFQYRHGLKADGIVGPRTLSELKKNL